MEPLTFIALPLCTRSKNRGMAAAVKVLREASITDSLRKNVGTVLDAGDVQISEIDADSGPNNLTNFQFLQDTEGIRSAVSRVDTEGLMFAWARVFDLCGDLGRMEGQGQK